MRSSPKKIAVLLTATTGALFATVVTAQQASAANLLLAPMPTRQHDHIEAAGPG